jgi:hypothetical protein
MISGNVGNIAPEAQQPVMTESDSEQPAPVARIIEPKPSRAIPIWCAVIMAVLLSLMFQMRPGERSYNFFIEGNADADGASVLIDGQPVGTMSASEDGGVRLIGLRCSVADGNHTVEVIKPGYAPVKTQVEMRGEDYIGVQLSKQ